MSQQINNAKFMRHIVKMNYRICHYFKKERENLDYDIKINNRYYKEILQQKQHAVKLNTFENKIFV